jgi:hypothetical protein
MNATYTTAACLGIVSYVSWRNYLLKCFVKWTENLGEKGFVIIPGQGHEEKKSNWNHNKNIYETIWKDRFGCLDNICMTKQDEMNATITVEHLESFPKRKKLHLISQNWRVQGIAITLLDPNFLHFDFGEQTHWIIQLLINPLRLILPRGICNYILGERLSLQGPDEAWRIMNFAKSHLDVGVPKNQFCLHVDAGYRNRWDSDSIPQPKNFPQEHNFSFDEMVMIMQLFQFMILFYCETPGRLTKERGCTGIIEGSHKMLIEQIHKVKQIPDLKCFVQDWLPNVKCLITQPEIGANEQLLIMGMIAHVSMNAVELMGDSDDIDSPRMIHNCKIFARGMFDPEDKTYDISKIKIFMSKISKDSVFYKLHVKER